MSVRDNLIVPYGEVPFLCLLKELVYQWFEDLNNYEIGSYTKRMVNLSCSFFVLRLAIENEIIYDMCNRLHKDVINWQQSKMSHS